MGRGKARTLLERTKVIALHELGQSVAQIVNQTGVPRQTCYDWIRNFRETNKVPEVKKRDCAPRKVTLAHVQTILREIKLFPRTTARLIRSKHASLRELSISTINKIIRWVIQLIKLLEDRARFSSELFSKLTGTDFILYICNDQSRLSWLVVLLSTSTVMLVCRYWSWISLMQADCSSELLISGLRTILSYFCVRNLSMSAATTSLFGDLVACLARDRVASQISLKLVA